MTQQAPAQQTAREEERVLPIAYDRALVMVPKLAQEATGSAVEVLGDGYFVVQAATGRQQNEVTIRLGRQGADTRLSVRVESVTDTASVILLVCLILFTAGIGVLFMIPWLQARARRAMRERDLLSHRIFRAVEDAVAEQGESPGYRVAPGADANLRVEEPEEPSAASEESSRREASR